MDDVIVNGVATDLIAVLKRYNALEQSQQEAVDAQLHQVYNEDVEFELALNTFAEIFEEDNS